MWGELKRFVVGAPVSRARLAETLLPKRVALPVFCSDPISSVAYATEQIVLVLALGGAAALTLSTPVAGAVAVLLVVVVASYRQTVHAYPNGGGAYVVSRENLGERPALVAGAALLVDYVMTVAVSVTSGVIAVTSAVRPLAPHAATIAAVAIMVLAVVNLRGIRESGRLFAVPTYLFIALTYLLLVFAAVKGASGALPPAESANLPVPETAIGTLALAVLLLRAFSSGCTALTGVEAISNGVPAFRPPKARNAATTLLMMGVVAVTLLVGITVLAAEMSARAEPDGNPSVISQLAAGSFGDGSVLYYLYQAATAAILVLAANTAFNGFPMLASILARDDHLPRQLANRGDRLVFSNGILLLGAIAAALILAVDANLTTLLHLYILGVFTSFTLSQAGMVRYWRRRLAEGGPVARARRAQLINLTGALLTGTVLVVVLVTKFAEGAWVAILAMALTYVGMQAVHRYYRGYEAEIAAPAAISPLTGPAHVQVVVLVRRLTRPSMRAVALARSVGADAVEAVAGAEDDAAAAALRAAWQARAIDVPLHVLEVPGRSIAAPLAAHVATVRARRPEGVVLVFVPEVVVTRWWQNLLHNQLARRIEAHLLEVPGVVVVDVPYRLGSREVGWLAGTDEPAGPGTTGERAPNPTEPSGAVRGTGAGE
ncbi:MAG: APC family permease [Pseudonocardia sp.]